MTEQKRVVEFFLLTHGDLNEDGHHTDDGRLVLLKAFEHLNALDIKVRTNEPNAACREAAGFIDEVYPSCVDFADDGPIAEFVDAADIPDQGAALEMFNRIVQERGRGNLTIQDLVMKSPRFAMLWGTVQATLNSAAHTLRKTMYRHVPPEEYLGVVILVDPSVASAALPMHEMPRREGDIVRVNYLFESARTQGRPYGYSVIHRPPLN
jgi:hypothetical protein